VDHNESWQQAAVREVREETGVLLAPEEVKVCCVVFCCALFCCVVLCVNEWMDLFVWVMRCVWCRSFEC
jgi:8-oxo-dGTP pyrophosphatase MutT (NUDIX family)